MMAFIDESGITWGVTDKGKHHILVGKENYEVLFTGSDRHGKQYAVTVTPPKRGDKGITLVRWEWNKGKKGNALKGWNPIGIIR